MKSSLDRAADRKLMDEARKLARQHGKTQLINFGLTDGMGNRSELVVDVDHAGWLRYSLGNEALSNLGAKGERPLQPVDGSLEATRVAVQQWILSGTRKVIRITIFQG